MGNRQLVWRCWDLLAASVFFFPHPLFWYGRGCGSEKVTISFVSKSDLKKKKKKTHIE